MTSLAWLLPAALLLGSIGLAGFLWALRSGQFDDLEGASWRVISDDEIVERDIRQDLPPVKGGRRNV